MSLGGQVLAMAASGSQDISAAAGMARKARAAWKQRRGEEAPESATLHLQPLYNGTINLMLGCRYVLPVAINLDNVPGADAFSIRIYASTAQQPKGVSIRQGTLDIVLFDGTFPPNQPITGKPLRIWSFSPQQLKALANENRLGTGYEFTLPWAGTPPTRNRVTVFARYRPKSGNPVVSGPSAISLATR
jgi:hypothetical protein